MVQEGFMPGHNIITIGTSAGGVEALVKLVRQLPRDLPAAVFVVLHIPAQGASFLPEILNRWGELKAMHATDDMEIQQGYIYVAPPDHHLLIEQGHMHIVHGPKENHHRPSADVLFRSAAITYGPRVIGVVLTGALHDGTAGLLAIKQCGGTAVVQDPDDAYCPNMPANALTHVIVDYCVPLSEMGALLMRLAREPVKAKEQTPSISQADVFDELLLKQAPEMDASEHSLD